MEVNVMKHTYEKPVITVDAGMFDDKGFNWPLVITRFIAIAMTGWMCMP